MFEASVARGAIQNKKRYKQLFDYSGLLFERNITPSDIDGLIDFNGNAFVYMEAKLIGVEVKKGQRIALENIIKSHEKAGHKAVAIVWRHNVKADEIIEAHNKLVDEYYLNHTKDGFKWITIKNKINLLTFIKSIKTHWMKIGYKL